MALYEDKLEYLKVFLKKGFDPKSTVNFKTYGCVLPDHECIMRSNLKPPIIMACEPSCDQVMRMLATKYYPPSGCARL